MQSVVTPSNTHPTWQADVLVKKAQRYAEKMEVSDDWEEVLWSSLSLELLVRAALSAISPALLADPEKWQNIFHALGFIPSSPKFVPKSISITAAVTRLNEILPDFNAEHQSFCTLHVGRRNAELHSGETPLDGLAGSAWKAEYYKSVKVLLSSLNMELADFFSEELAKLADSIIAAADDKAAKAVLGDIEAHAKVWMGKEANDRTGLIAQAAAWASKTTGHRANCPACKSLALVFGEPVAPPTRELDGDLIVETQTYLPSRFECIACGLKIVGLARLHAAELGDTFKRTQEYEAADFYASEDPEPDWEPDFND